METNQTIDRLPRMPISRRPWSRAQRLMRERNISQREIADITELPVSTVNRVLSFTRCGQTAHQTVMRVRQIAITLLIEAGPVEDLATLWDEYDNKLLWDVL